MDAMTALALGSGFQTLGRGLGRYNDDLEDRRRYDESMAARKAEADEMRAWRAEQSDLARAARREANRSQRRQELQSYWAQQGVVLSPDRLNALIAAEEGEEVEAAAGATVPTGDELPTAPRRRPADAMAEIARRGLEASRMSQGARVPLDEEYGFAQDEGAYNAAVRAQQAREADEREAKLRRALAEIAKGSGQGGSTRDALTRVERQIDDTRSDMGQVRLQMPRDAEYRDPLTRELDAGALGLARAPFTTRLGELESRADSLGGVRDSLVSELQGRPFVRPTAPAPRPEMDPREKAAMERELNDAATEVKAILDSPNATAQDKAEARALLQELQTDIVRRYPAAMGGRRPAPASRPVSALPTAAPQPPVERGSTVIGVRTQPPERAASTPFTANGRFEGAGTAAPPGTMEAMVAVATGAPRIRTAID